MAGLADLLYLGQPDPARQLAAMLSGPQPGGPGAGPPGAPPAGPAPPPAGPPDDPTNPSGQPNPAPGAPPPPGSQPQPTALQSTPDMQAAYAKLANPPNIMSLYLQMDARDRAEDQINHGLALMATHWASPESARAIMQSVPSAQNAGQTASTLMSLYGAQNQMAAQQQMLGQAPAIAQKLGMDEGIVRAEIMAGRGDELVRSLEPTTETRDIQAKHDMFVKNAVGQGSTPQAAEQDWQTNYMPFLLTGGMGGDSASKSWQQERIRWNQDNPGQPYPWGTDNPMSFALWKKKQDDLNADQTEAATKLHNGYDQNITDLRNHLGSIIGLKPGGDPNNPADYDQAKQAVLQSALSKPGAQAYLSGEPQNLATQTMGMALSPEEKAVLDEVRETTDKTQLFGTLNARAPKRGVSDINAIGSSLSSMQNIRQGFDRFLGTTKTAITAADTALGNGFGAAGEAENAPDYTKPLISDAYLPGGPMYPYGKKPTPMSPDQINAAKARINAAPDPAAMRKSLAHYFLTNNVDPSPLGR
jgi:hypothetical protein